MKYEVQIDEQALNLEINSEDNKVIVTSKLGQSVLDIAEVDKAVYSVLMNNHSFVVRIGLKQNKRIYVNGTPFNISLLDAVHLHLRDLGWESKLERNTGLIESQIPGLISKIFHQVGDAVQEGEHLFLMEAMKMENEIQSPVAGRILKLNVSEGQTVEKGTILAEIG